MSLDGTLCDSRLRRHILSAPTTNRDRHQHQSGRPTVLSPAAETELAAYIKNLPAAGFPLTRQEIRSLAFEYAVANDIRGFSEDDTRSAITAITGWKGS